MENEFKWKVIRQRKRYTLLRACPILIKGNTAEKAHELSVE
jgi:hypothetical protein